MSQAWIQDALEPGIRAAGPSTRGPPLAA
jgi:hypothetical protein